MDIRETRLVIAVVDWNGQQIDGANEDVMSLGDLEGKWKSFGWKVSHMDGNSFESLIPHMEEVIQSTGNKTPQVILMKTDMGKGVDFMEGTHQWHGKAPNAEQTENALAQLEETLGDY